MSQQHILQVSELTKKVKFMLESELNTVWLCGEISNFIAASSGHWYLSLKDNKSQVKCAMFKGNNRRVRLTGPPRNGQQVLVRAKVSLYEPRGDFQLIIDLMEDAGEGLLRQKYEQLKNKLDTEGLFSQHHKQLIPQYIKSIGIVTSATGAAVKDILTVLKRRNPLIKVIIYPTLVQGNQAHYDIVQAIELANVRNECDVLIIGRGGGSLEDLWPFNEEDVVRAIYKSHIPTISAVGHEVDTTLADFVADMRAPTPSAAAEMAADHLTVMIDKLQVLKQRIIIAHKNNFSNNKQLNHNLQQRLSLLHPAQKLQLQQQKLDELSLRLKQIIKHEQLRFQQRPKLLQQRLSATGPVTQIREKLTLLKQLEQRLKITIQRGQELRSQQFAHIIEQLHLVSPLATIARGYSVTRNNQGKVISKINELAVGDNIKVQISDGQITAKISQLD
ncbi:MAG: exodeoxyribonuclease VII large subunit [Alteromonadaceae bacterium]|jgi:exodeoxyribonuclease VII large subunit